jgi:hypothetical protein
MNTGDVGKNRSGSESNAQFESIGDASVARPGVLEWGSGIFLNG